MKIDKIYYLFIGSAVLFHTIAIILTWYAITYMGLYECNQIMDKAFFINGGFAESIIVTDSLVVLIMILVPILFGEIGKIGIRSAIIEFGAICLLVLDCFHDIFVVSDNPLAYVTGWIINTMFSILGVPSVC